MSGHIRKTNNNYYIVLELEPVNGKRQQKWLSVRKELGLKRPAKWREASQLLTTKLKELNEGTYYQPADMPLEEYLKLWLKNYVYPNCKQKTIDFYELLINNHINPEIGAIPLNNLKPIDIQKLVTRKSTGGRLDGKEGGLSKRSIQGIVALLRLSLDHAINWEYIHRNVAKNIKVKTPDKKLPAAWNQIEMKLFLAHVQSNRHYPLYLMALTTGMRLGEILGLRWEDIQGNRITVNQNLTETKKGIIIDTPKTAGSGRTIEVSRKLIKVLDAHKEKQDKEFEVLGISPDHGLVFTSEAGTPMRPRNLNRQYRNALASLEIKQIKFQNLRDTHATLCLESGMHIKAVAERLGHSDEVMALRRYAHVLPKIARKGASVLDKSIPD